VFLVEREQAIIALYFGIENGIPRRMNVRQGIPFFLFAGDWAPAPSDDQQQQGAD
jgi:hypothetical protein